MAYTSILLMPKASDVHTKITNATEYSTVELSTYAGEQASRRLVRRDITCGNARNLHHGVSIFLG
jgi:hypothetical protein